MSVADKYLLPGQFHSPLSVARTCPSLRTSCGSWWLAAIVIIQQRAQTYIRTLAAGHLCILSTVTPLG